MIVKASACSRADLQRAFDEYAEAHSLERAIAALEAATGARNLAAVPEHRIVNGLTELICGFSFVGRATPGGSVEQRLATVYNKLAAIGTDAFDRMRAKAAG